MLNEVPNEGDDVSVNILPPEEARAAARRPPPGHDQGDGRRRSGKQRQRPAGPPPFMDRMRRLMHDRREIDTGDNPNKHTKVKFVLNYFFLITGIALFAACVSIIIYSVARYGRTDHLPPDMTQRPGSCPPPGLGECTYTEKACPEEGSKPGQICQIECSDDRYCLQTTTRGKYKGKTNHDKCCDGCCKPPANCTRPCRNQGICIGMDQCLCSVGYSGQFCETSLFTPSNTTKTRRKRFIPFGMIPQSYYQVKKRFTQQGTEKEQTPWRKGKSHQKHSFHYQQQEQEEQGERDKSQSQIQSKDQESKPVSSSKQRRYAGSLFNLL